MLRIAFVLMLLTRNVTADDLAVAAPPRDWTVQYGTAERDYGYRVAVDGQGHVYVVGRTDGTLPGCRNQGGSDAFLLKFCSDDPTSKKAFQWGYSGNDLARAVAVDSCDNVYVAGSFNQGENQTGYLRKIDACGRFVFQREFRIGQGAYPDGCVVDRCGNVYVLGRSSSAEEGWFAFVKMFNQENGCSRTLKLGTASDESVWPRDICLHPHGGLVVSGSVQNRLGELHTNGNEDAFLARISPQFEWAWVGLSGIAGKDSAGGVGVRSDGTIVSSGYKVMPDDTKASLVATDDEDEDYVNDYPPDGIPLGFQLRGKVSHHLLVWQGSKLQSEIPTTLRGGARSLSLISDDEVFVAGATVAARFQLSTGTVKWKQNLPWSTLGTCRDRQGRLYVTGAVNNSLHGQHPHGENDAFVVRFAP